VRELLFFFVVLHESPPTGRGLLVFVFFPRVNLVTPLPGLALHKLEFASRVESPFH